MYARRVSNHKCIKKTTLLKFLKMLSIHKVDHVNKVIYETIFFITFMSELVYEYV